MENGCNLGEKNMLIHHFWWFTQFTQFNRQSTMVVLEMDCEKFE